MRAVHNDSSERLRIGKMEIQSIFTYINVSFVYTNVRLAAADPEAG
jgi:hypothetical protein